MRQSRLLRFVCSIGAATLALLVVFATVAQAVRALHVVACADERDGRDDEDGRDEQGADDADADVSPELFNGDALGRHAGRALPPHAQLIAILPAPVARPWSPCAAPRATPPLESFVRLQL